MLPRMWESVGEWTFTLLSELPFWELESQWTLEFSDNQNPWNWGIICIIGKFLELRCLKWACMTHLDILNISYGQKRGQESNWQFDSRPLKIKNHPDFLVCRWHATYCWKDFDKGYNFTLDLMSIEGLHTKLWAPKIMGVLIVGVSRQNDIWVLILWPGTKYTIRGKVMASPKSGPWWVLWICVCLQLVHVLKCFNYALTNLLFGLCRSVWVIELFVNFSNPIPELQHTPLPRSATSQGARPNSFSFYYSLLDSQLSPSRSLGVCQLDFSFYKFFYVYVFTNLSNAKEAMSY